MSIPTEPIGSIPRPAPSLDAIAKLDVSDPALELVINPIDPRGETPEEVRDRILEAAKYISIEQFWNDR